MGLYAAARWEHSRVPRRTRAVARLGGHRRRDHWRSVAALRRGTRRDARRSARVGVSCRRLARHSLPARNAPPVWTVTEAASLGRALALKQRFKARRLACMTRTANARFAVALLWLLIKGVP